MQSVLPGEGDEERRLNFTHLNKAANARIRAYCDEMGISHCEIRLPGCMGRFGLSNAHRHKRVWYKRFEWDEQETIEALSDPTEWVKGCAYCHQRIEKDKELTEEVFMRLRGESDVESPSI